MFSRTGRWAKPMNVTVGNPGVPTALNQCPIGATQVAQAEVAIGRIRNPHVGPARGHWNVELDGELART